MEIHQLRYFVAVAEEGSFSNAAEREHVSQPSLSQQIHKLEEELNQQLFDRLPRSVVLTEAGRTLLVYARQILSGIAEGRQAVTALEHEVAGKLSVGAIPSIALYVLPGLIGSFQRSYPKVTFELFEDTTDRMVAAGLGVTVIPQMMLKTEFVKGCVAVPFAKPVPTRELTLLRNPLRAESKAAAAFREEAAAAFLT